MLMCSFVAGNQISRTSIRACKVRLQHPMGKFNGRYCQLTMKQISRTTLALPVSIWLLLAACSSAPPPTPEPAKTAAAPAQPAVPAAPATPQPAKAPEPQDFLPADISKPSAPFEGEGWRDMFDGQTLEGWTVTKFGGGAEVEARRGVILLNMGDPFTGINYTNEFPKVNYEIALDAMRVMGSDFFCGLTVPVKDSFCSLIVGGWGGGLVGISSLDGMDASENETTRYMNFEKGRWYRIRVRVTENRIEAWIDNEKTVNVVTTDRRISLRPGDIEMSKPMGIASWQTASALRAIKVRSVDGPAGPAPKL